VPFGTDLPNPNFATIAQAFGAEGIRVDDASRLQTCIAEALAHTGGPVVLDVVVDTHALALPSHVPGETARGFTLSAAKRMLHGQFGDVLHEATDNIKLL
jgi:pyruvate dehydrogenase (quinone)